MTAACYDPDEWVDEDEDIGEWEVDPPCRTPLSVEAEYRAMVLEDQEDRFEEFELLDI